MTWLLIVFSALMLAWLVSVLAQSNNCAHEQFHQLCKASEDAQRSNDFVIVLVIYFMGFVILALVWFMTRPREQTQA
jgi:uncharacterized protein (DUF983 family)